MIESVHVTTVKLTYSLITLLIITEYSDSARVWKVGGVWNTTQRAELTERMKRLRATNTQPDNSTLRRMEGQKEHQTTTERNDYDNYNSKKRDAVPVTNAETIPEA